MRRRKHSSVVPFPVGRAHMWDTFQIGSESHLGFVHTKTLEVADNRVQSNFSIGRIQATLKAGAGSRRKSDRPARKARTGLTFSLGQLAAYSKK